MIDFRYHLVSLIAVFLALAVGIVLGAGPLRDTVSDQLAAQVEALRSEMDTQRAELDEARAELAEARQFVDESAPGLLADVLPGWEIALVALPRTDDDVLEAVTERIEQAGGQVVSTTVLTDMWADPAQGAYRSQIAEGLTPLLESTSHDGSTESVLSAALGYALTAEPEPEAEPEAEATDPAPEETTDAAPSPDGGETPASAAIVLTALTGGDEPLAVVEQETELAPADLVLVVGPDVVVSDDPTETADPDAEEQTAAWIALVRGLAGAGEGAVLAGFANDGTDLVAQVRSSANDAVTTVDGVDDLFGQISVPRALAAVAVGTPVGHYGSGEGATAAVPPLVAIQPPFQAGGLAGIGGVDADGSQDSQEGE